MAGARRASPHGLHTVDLPRPYDASYASKCSWKSLKLGAMEA